MNRQEELEDLSKFEINKLVASIAEGFNESAWPEAVRMGDILTLETEDEYEWLHPNYCGEPSDIMPIALENKFTLNWMEQHGKYEILDKNSEFVSYHVNPYRAICIVFLLIQEKINES